MADQVRDEVVDEAGEGQSDFSEEMEQDLSDSCIFVLLELHEFIKRIFRSLPMKTLNTCGQVCKKWYHLTKKEKLRRQRPMWLFYDHFKCGISGSLEEPIMNSRIEPHLAIVFLSSGLHDCKLRVPAQSVAVTSRHPRAAKHEKKDFMDYLGRLLPRSCRTLGIITDGIVGTIGDDPCEKESACAASVLILPRLPDFHVSPFVLSKSQADKVFTEDEPLGTKEQILELLNAPSGLTPKIVMTFNSDAMFDNSVLFEKSVLHHFDGKVVVAGGFTDNLVPDEVKQNSLENEGDTLLTGLVFCGPGVQMAAAVLDQSVRTPEAAQAVISQLKQTNISCDQTLAFMFACIGRGHYHYNDENVETKAFRKVFPRVPIFGFFGNGEVGHDFLPDYSKPGHEEYTILEKDSEGEECNYPPVRHSYTTIMVVVSRVTNSHTQCLNGKSCAS